MYLVEKYNFINCTTQRKVIVIINKLRVLVCSIVILNGYKLQHLASTNIVVLIWVPGHSGVSGNKRADKFSLVQEVMTPFVVLCRQLG